MSHEISTVIDQYIEEHPKYASILSILREIMDQTELVPAMKWSKPTYSLAGKNVASICAFKNGAGIWFFQGALMKDQLKVLANAQEGKTHAMRRWIFQTDAEVDKKQVLQYISEAIINERAGKRVKIKRQAITIKLPIELKDALVTTPEAEAAFNALTPGKRKDYCLYITTAKRPATKNSRLEKILPMILKGEGLNDKYAKK